MITLDGSILDDVKKILGIDSTYTAFDTDIIIHINSVFFTLNQLGLGPPEGFSIEDNSTQWSAYVGTDKNLAAVKTYLYLRVRVLFDPPSTSFHLSALNDQIKEMEWRLNVHREDTEWEKHLPPISP